MIQAESDPQKRDEYLQRLMELPNQVCFDLEFACPTLSLAHTHTDTLIQFAQDVFLACCLSYCMPFLLMQKWVEIIGKARQSVDFLKDQDVIRTVLNILQVLLSNQP